MFATSTIKHPKLHNPIDKHFNFITRYHYFMFFVLFSSEFPIFWHVINLIFLTPPMDYHCNHTIFNNSTKNVCPCDNPQWNRSVFIETMQTKFGILCDSNWLINFSQSIYFTGILLGTLTLGFLSDKYVRLPIYTISCLFLAIFGCLVSAMPTAASFIFMRSLEGFGAGGAVITSYVLCVEYCSVTHRELVTALFHLPINLGHMTLPLVSYLLRHCDELQLAVSIPIFLLVGVKVLVMESPRWLMDNGHIDEAVAVMVRFERFNEIHCEDMRKEIEEYLSSQKNKSHMHMKFWQIFRHKKLSVNLGCMSVLYFLCGLGCYGVSQYIGKMTSNIHLNVVLSGALLLPGTIAAAFLLKLLPRRLLLMGINFLSASFMIIVIWIPIHMNWARVIIACICNCFFFMLFIIIFLYSVELFPTSVRNSVFGFLSVILGIGQIIASEVNVLSNTASGVIYGAMAIFATILCYILPETKNVELPSSLNECKVMSREMKQLEEYLPTPIQINPLEMFK